MAVIGYGQSLTVRRQERDRNGDLVSGATDSTSTGWRIAPADSPEQASGARDSTTFRLECFRRGRTDDVDIRPADRVLLEGDTAPVWEVDGGMSRWGDAVSGALGGLVVRLKRVEG